MASGGLLWGHLPNGPAHVASPQRPLSRCSFSLKSSDFIAEIQNRLCYPECYKLTTFNGILQTGHHCIIVF